MQLEIIDNKNFPLISKKFLKDFLQFLEQAFVEKKIIPASSNKKLVISFVSSKNIQNLNQNFLKKNYVTDILSFSPSEKDSFGELALCGEQIISQAKDHKLTVEEETAYLVLHGFLHLLGYHHEQGGKSAKKMYKIQDELFTKWQILKRK